MEIESVRPPHGQKRPPDNDLEGEQRLTKRFNLLNIDQNGQYYVPVKPAPPRRSRSNAISDSMHVDESRDRVYIHDLDEAVSDAESDEDKLVFLPDIEKKLARIPRSVLTGEPQPLKGNEVVLYGVPPSLSIPENQDNVRKAIIESRHRAQVKQASEAAGGSLAWQGQESSASPQPSLNGRTNGHHMSALGSGVDGMDLD